MCRLSMTSLLLCLWLVESCQGNGDGSLQDIMGELHTDFAVRLYQTLTETENRSNLVVSPASVSLSLALLQLGARGNTLAQLEGALGYNANDAQVHDFLLRPQGDVGNSSQGVRLQQACALFVQSGVKLLTEFTQHAAAWGNSSLVRANFSQPDHTRSQLEQWGRNHGNSEARAHQAAESREVSGSGEPQSEASGWGGRRLQGEAPGSGWGGRRLQGEASGSGWGGRRLQGEAPGSGWGGRRLQGEAPGSGWGGRRLQMALVNTVAFRGAWQKQFLFGDTQNLPFTLSDGRAVKVPMMHQAMEGRFGQFRAPSELRYSVLELPYLGPSLSLLVALPSDRKTPLASLEPQLGPRAVAAWDSGLRRTKMDVFLPRFRMETRLNLRSVIAAMGVSDAFSPTAADFRGISAEEGLYVSDAFHQARIEVTEDGTKAAAATAMVLLKRSRAPVFKADRPFFFLLRQVSTGSILFMGRVLNPADQSP